MPLPRWVARFNLRVTNRVLGPLARQLPMFGVVTHIGRKTGRRYTTPVNVFRHGDHVTIALTYGPGAHWVQNVLAEGGCELTTRGRTLRLTSPRVIHDPGRRAVPVFVRPILAVLNASDFLEMERR